MVRPPPRPTLFPYTTLFRSILDLAQRIKRLTGCAGEIVFQPLHYADVEIRSPNVRQARELLGFEAEVDLDEDRKSTRLNSSHPSISYAVFCLKKKTTHAAAM